MVKVKLALAKFLIIFALKNLHNCYCTWVFSPEASLIKQRIFQYSSWKKSFTVHKRPFICATIRFIFNRSGRPAVIRERRFSLLRFWSSGFQRCHKNSPFEIDKYSKCKVDSGPLKAKLQIFSSKLFNSCCDPCS